MTHRLSFQIATASTMMSSGISTARTASISAMDSENEQAKQAVSSFAPVMAVYRSQLDGCFWK